MKNRALWANSRHFLNVRPVYALGQFFLDNLPLWVGYGITRGTIEVAYRASHRLRTLARSNIRHVLGRIRPGLPDDKLDREAREIAYRLWINRGRWFADQTVIAGNRRLEDLVHVDFEGTWERFDALRNSDRGAILASAHLGNWPGGGLAIAKLGVPVRSVLYDNHAGSTMDLRFARRGNIEPIRVGGDPFSMVDIVRALRGGKVIAVLVDRPWDSRSLTLPFFGRPSRFPLGAVRIARVAGVPLYPAFCVNTGRLRYKATLCEPIEVEGDDPEEAERAAMTRIISEIERRVAAHLDVWFGAFHPVWETP